MLLHDNLLMGIVEDITKGSKVQQMSPRTADVKLGEVECVETLSSPVMKMFKVNIYGDRLALLHDIAYTQPPLPYPALPCEFVGPRGLDTLAYLAQLFQEVVLVAFTTISSLRVILACSASSLSFSLSGASGGRSGCANRASSRDRICVTCDPICRRAARGSSSICVSC